MFVQKKKNVNDQTGGEGISHECFCLQYLHEISLASRTKDVDPIVCLFTGLVWPALF